MRRSVGDGLELDDDPDRVDIDAVHAFLSNEAYWAIGRSREAVARLLGEARRVVGLYEHGRQVGLARAAAVSETTAYLADVYVLPHLRGRGLGKELVVEAVDNGPYHFTRWLLHTADAHDLYRSLGFGDPTERVMERVRPKPAPPA